MVGKQTATAGWPSLVPDNVLYGNLGYGILDSCLFAARSRAILPFVAMIRYPNTIRIPKVATTRWTNRRSVTVPLPIPSRPATSSCLKSTSQPSGTTPIAHLIPEALSVDVRPSASSDGSDTIRVADQKIPCVLASGNNGLVAFPHQQTQLVGTEVVPDVLHRVEFW